MSWDTIVIGSGPGGLAAGVALARMGQRVLILEQHYLPGGWTHSFTLEHAGARYKFSPGVHYVGEVGPGGGFRRVLEGLGLGHAGLEFCEMNPAGFDHFRIGPERFDQPRGLEAWIRYLKDRFPDESDGLDRYFTTLVNIARDIQRCDSLLAFPNVLTLPWRAPSLTYWGLRRHAALLNSCIEDPILRAILSAQSGNHGLAPSRVSLAVHAAMTNHYLDGAFYPRHGAGSIPRACIRVLKEHGGHIRVKVRVQRILVERGRAVGVELADGEVIHAKNVVCNADPAVVYGRLLDPAYCQRELHQVERMEYSVSTLSAFCVVRMPLRRMGYDSGNYWWYRTSDVDGLYRWMENYLPGGRMDGAFVAITSLKDPQSLQDKLHTLEIFSFVPHAPFAKWQGTQVGARGHGYEAFKEMLGDMLLEAAEHVIPGLRQHLVCCSIGTPLTNTSYCETHEGAAYGTAKTPLQLGPFSFSQRGPIDHLYLCGASTLSHGVAGATMSGLFAACYVLGLTPRNVEQLLAPADGSLRVYPADTPQLWLPGAQDHRSAAPQTA